MTVCHLPISHWQLQSLVFYSPSQVVAWYHHYPGYYPFQDAWLLGSRTVAYSKYQTCLLLKYMTDSYLRYAISSHLFYPTIPTPFLSLATLHLLSFFIFFLSDRKIVMAWLRIVSSLNLGAFFLQCDMFGNTSKSFSIFTGLSLRLGIGLRCL